MVVMPIPITPTSNAILFDLRRLKSIWKSCVPPKMVVALNMLRYWFDIGIELAKEEDFFTLCGFYELPPRKRIFPYPFSMLFISLSLLSACKGVRLSISRERSESRICFRIGSSSWKKEISLDGLFS